MSLPMPGLIYSIFTPKWDQISQQPKEDTQKIYIHHQHHDRWVVTCHDAIRHNFDVRNILHSSKENI